MKNRLFAASVATLVAGAGLTRAAGEARPAGAPAVKGVTVVAPQAHAPVHHYAGGEEHVVNMEEDADCCCGTRLWVGGEFLMWWIKDSPLPPLLTSADPNLLAFNSGAFGAPGTQVLLGEEDLDNKLRYGGRFTAGYWFDDDQQAGGEVSYFFLGKRSVTRTIDSDPNAIVGVPIFEVTPPPGEAFIQLSSPGFFVSHTQLSLSTTLQGGEVSGLYALPSDVEGIRWVLLGGFRYLELDEKLALKNTSTGFDVATGFNFNFVDQFDTRNRFYGGQVGLRGEYAVGKLYFKGTGKVALGSMRETVDIGGQSVVTIPGLMSATLPGAIFAQQSNIGHYSRNRFAVIPEVTVNVGIQLNDNLRAFVGYNFLYVSDLLRAGNQIDRNINLTQSQVPGFGVGALAGAAQPEVLFNSSEFWAQGINYGIEIVY